MAEFTSDQLTQLADLAGKISSAADDCERELTVAYADEHGGLPEAWIIARPTESPVITFEPPEWLRDLFNEDDEDEAEDGDRPRKLGEGAVV